MQFIALIITTLTLFVSHSEGEIEADKRLLWMTHNRRMILPPKTILDIAPTLNVPFFRNDSSLPLGLKSDLVATWHFYMEFDKLGMTSDAHPWPPRYPFSGFFPFGNLPYPRPPEEMSTLLRKNTPQRTFHDNQYQFSPDRDRSYSSDEINGYLNLKYNRNSPGQEPAAIKYTASNQNQTQTQTETKSRSNAKDRIFVRHSQPMNENNNNNNRDKPQARNRRSVLSLPPPDSLPGGERAILIPQLERMISSMGHDGRACLLRTACEIHEFPLHRMGYGLLGEILTLVFSTSLSDYADSHMSQYLKAEEAGRAGECSAYFRNCSKSLFMWEEKNKYSEEMQNDIHT